MLNWTDRQDGTKEAWTDTGTHYTVMRCLGHYHAMRHTPTTSMSSAPKPTMEAATLTCEDWEANDADQQTQK